MLNTIEFSLTIRNKTGRWRRPNGQLVFFFEKEFIRRGVSASHI
jgi:hypothetical protein